jgi:hypothetical protein
MAFEKLSVSVTQECIDEWTIAEQKALQLRGDWLMIYSVDEDQGDEQLIKKINANRLFSTIAGSKMF